MNAIVKRIHVKCVVVDRKQNHVADVFIHKCADCGEEIFASHLNGIHCSSCGSKNTIIQTEDA